MTTYEFYWEDEEGKPHFFGTLPERRDPGRITEESILNWGRMLIGNSERIKKIYFTKKEEQAQMLNPICESKDLTCRESNTSAACRK